MAETSTRKERYHFSVPCLGPMVEVIVEGKVDLRFGVA